MSEWFEVVARVKIQGADDDDAINRVAGLLRGEKPPPGAARLFPVGSFHAEPCPDPTIRRSDVERRVV